MLPEVVTSRYTGIDIAVYFSGNTSHLYQLKQWVYPFIALNKTNPIVIVVRNIDVYQWVMKHTEFQVVYCKTMDDLLSFYEQNDFKCILYVNNASTNFQSLMNNRALHVHINHGESEKSSTFSNRAKAYDKVFLVSDAGYERYEQNLMNISMDRFVKIGRPQLDWFEPISLPRTNGRKVVLYGPTWEGAHLSMNFSSLVDFGSTIVEEILSSDTYFLVYRPHPSTGSRDRATAEADRLIREQVNTSDNAVVLDDCDINAVFSFIDISIFDNSAIAVDFLHYDKPMLMTDYFYRIQGRESRPKVVEACTLLNADNINDVLNIVENELTFDHHRDIRAEMRSYFLGNYRHGESTQAFIREVKQVIAWRNQLLAEIELKHANNYEN